MRPTVSLRRLDEHWENDPEVTAAKERKGNEKGNQN